MTNKIGTILGTALALAMTAGPALAGSVPKLPEPATMTLFGLGVAGAFVARKFLGRK